MDGDASRNSPVGPDQEYTRRGFLKTAAWGAAAVSAVSMAGCASGEEEQGAAGDGQETTREGDQAAGGNTASEARAAIVLSSNPLYDGLASAGCSMRTTAGPTSARSRPRPGG
jgi:hypothetical protein